MEQIGFIGLGIMGKPPNCWIRSSWPSISRPWGRLSCLRQRPESIQWRFLETKGGLAGTKVLNAKIPLIFGRNFKVGFKIGLHQKYLKKALEGGACRLGSW